jgi:C4-dicarboxylate transporter, DctM subunit
VDRDAPRPRRPLALATAAGLPIFAALGGAALLLFRADGAPVASVPIDAYALTSMPILPAVPLFTLSGYVLGAGRASDRLVRVFMALVGWLPGGVAVVTTLVFAFFTSFTGASGVTILTLGGLLLPALIKSRYPEGFSIGLVTVSGSIGLLLPPSLPVILYAVNARVPANELLIGGILPGVVFVVLVALLGVREGRRSGATRAEFRLDEARRAVWAAKWDLLLPLVVLVAIFGGFATMVEAAALTVLYAVFVQCVVYRDVSVWRDLPRVFGDCACLVGGFLVILAVAQGLTNYLTFAEVPTRALAFVQAHVTSPLVFLLVLNVFLLIVGALMDIYSAIFVVVPLIVPIAAAYGIDPVHLGVVFLANLELGYLTPPMGENLFLSAYRFDKPVLRVFRYSLPFYVVLAIGVLVITYLPALTMWPVRLLR